jgi:glycosyltransferase involved in cell wall biosynthesis
MRLSTSTTVPPSRIGIFNPALTGGGEIVLLHLAEGILDSGRPVDLVLGEATGPYVSRVNPKIRIIDLHAATPIAKLFALNRYLRAERPALLITADDFVNVASLAKRLSGADTIIAAGVHNTMSELFKTQRGLRALVRRALFPYLLRLADYVIPVSQCAAADVVSMAHIRADRVRVIYNAVLHDRIWTMAGEPAEHPFFQKGEPPVLISVGRLSPQKDFATLIHAFALVREVAPARLLILGQGDQRPELEELIDKLELRDDVSLPGFVNNPYAFIARSAAFVSSSIFEGLPTVLIEALALGTPVVATNCAGSAEVLENGKWGRLTPMSDPRALADAILRTLADRSLAPGVEASLRHRFSIPDVTRAFLELLPNTPMHPAGGGNIRSRSSLRLGLKLK